MLETVLWMGCMPSSVYTALPGPESTNNLYMAAIAVCHSTVGGVPFRPQNLVTAFLKRARSLCHWLFHKSSTLNLILVLDALKTSHDEYRLDEMSVSKDCLFPANSFSKRVRELPALAMCLPCMHWWSDDLLPCRLLSTVIWSTFFLKKPVDLAAFHEKESGECSLLFPVHTL